jgi:hypothetical protein
MISVSLQPPQPSNWLDETKCILELETPKLEYCQYFEFPLPPQTYTAEDTFTLQIIPTQDLMYVEHQGILQYTITITGTFGIYTSWESRMGMTMISPIAGAGMWKSAVDKISKGTGFAKIHELRTLLRKYASLKAGEKIEEGIDPSKVKLYFTNVKDNEVYEVEPLSFRVERNARARTLYTYILTMRAIKPSDQKRVKPKSWWLTAYEGIKAVMNSLNQLNALVTAVIGSIQELALAPLRVFNTLIGLATTVKNFTGLWTDLFPLIRERYESAGRALVEAWQSLSEDQRKELLSRNNLPITDTSNRALFPSTSFKDIAKTFNEGIKALKDIMLSSGDMLKYGGLLQQLISSYALLVRLDESGISNYTETRSYNLDEEATLVGQLTSTSSTAYLSAFGNPPPASAVRPVRVQGGDNIYTIAQRELGDWRYWRVIASMNKLKYPYVWYRKLPGVAIPGDTIYVPQFGASISPVSRKGSVYREIAKEDLALGVDLFTAEGDLVLNARKDLGLAIGYVALKQALRRRLSTPLGMLFMHPTYGTLEVGRKLTQLKGVTLRQLISFIMEDPRIERVIAVQSSVEGDTAQVNVLLKPVELTDIISVKVLGE